MRKYASIPFLLFLFIVGGVVLLPSSRIAFAGYLENVAYSLGFTSSTRQLEALCNQANTQIVVRNVGGDFFDFILPGKLYRTNNRIETIGWYTSTESLIRFVVNGTKSPFKPFPWVSSESCRKYTKTNPGAEFVIMFVTGENWKK